MDPWGESWPPGSAQGHGFLLGCGIRQLVAEGCYGLVGLVLSDLICGCFLLFIESCLRPVPKVILGLCASSVPDAFECTLEDPLRKSFMSNYGVQTYMYGSKEYVVVHFFSISMCECSLWSIKFIGLLSNFLPVYSDLKI